MPTGLLHRPYDLIEVPREARNHDEHYIMSLKGVTCISGGIICEYISWQQWDHHRRHAMPELFQPMVSSIKQELCVIDANWLMASD